MDSKKKVVAVGAIVVILIALVLIVRQVGPKSRAKPPVARWVCDQCGAEATKAAVNASPDCSKCDKGQMVQRVFRRCKRCGEEFEAYQMNWSPMSPRGAAKRAEADAQEKMPPTGQAAVLARRPGGTWAWIETKVGSETMSQLACPKCGPGSKDQFEKAR